MCYSETEHRLASNLNGHAFARHKRQHNNENDFYFTETGHFPHIRSQIYQALNVRIPTFFFTSKSMNPFIISLNI